MPPGPSGSPNVNNFEVTNSERTQQVYRKETASPIQTRTFRTREQSYDSSTESESETESESDDSDDDVPLASRIPGALRAQKTLAVKTRSEQTGAQKQQHSRHAQVLAQKRPRVDGRDNPKWAGEGGVPARELEVRLQRALLSAATATSRHQHQTLEGNSVPTHTSSSSSSLHSSIGRRNGRSITEHYNGVLPDRGQTSQDAHNSGLSRQATMHRTTSRKTSLTGAHLTEHGLLPPPLPKLGLVPPVPDPKEKRYSPHQSPLQPNTEWLADSPEPHVRSPTLEARSMGIPLDRSQTLQKKASQSRLLKKPSLGYLSHTRTPLVGSTDTRARAAEGSTSKPNPRSDPNARRVFSDPTKAPPLPIVGHVKVHFDDMAGTCQMVGVRSGLVADEFLSTLMDQVSPTRDPRLEWTLFEVFGEFENAERPVRMFESIPDIVAGWTASMGKNAFVIKRSPLHRLVLKHVSIGSFQYPTLCWLTPIHPSDGAQCVPGSRPRGGVSGQKGQVVKTLDRD